MLNEKEFYQYVEANILNYLPEMEGKKVMVQRVKRNNQISMMGLSIGETKNYLVPVLYLEIFYRNYLRGQELSDTMKDIARIYRGHQVGFYLDEDKVSDYEHIKKNLFYRVVNYEKNKEMLKYTPYERFLDLAVTYRWAAYRNHDGMASALVRNKELLLWGVTKEQMMKDAKENTEKIFPPVMRKIQSVMPVKITDMEIPLFVLSNGDYMNGASVMLYKDPLRDFANYMGHDLYILPSSIHEVIAVSADMGNPTELADMVSEVNMSAVAIGDRLSNQVYHYDKDLRKVTLATDTPNKRLDGIVSEAPLVFDSSKSR